MTCETKKTIDDPNFDWVTARFRCTPKNAFFDLCESIKKNVDAVNGAVAPKCEDKTQLPFYHENGSWRFAVMRRKDGASVSFELNGNNVRVSDGNDAIFCFTVEWDRENAECYFKADGERLSCWRISEKALYSLFFDA